jgi:hypothetical protein
MIGDLTRGDALQLLLNNGYQVTDLGRGSGPYAKTIAWIEKSVFLLTAVESHQYLVK